MELRVGIGDETFGVDLTRPRSLAIPLRFNGPQPSFFGAPPANATPLQGDGFVGDTRRGGSCNVAEIRIVPHCNGTHTEGVGHIVDSEHAVFECVRQSLMPAVVTSVTPVPAASSGESCRPGPDPRDALITRASLKANLDVHDDDELAALVVRTLPNDAAKLAAEYGDRRHPPFFTADAMRYVVDRGVQHLLVDIPSIDRMHDEGRLTNHHIFWNVPEGARDGTRDTQVNKSVTELIFVENEIGDGLYLLNLQLPAFHSDAAPCRPVIYDLIPEC